MHDTALQLGELFFNIHGADAKNVLDVGALDVNGSLRSVCPDHLEYTGADMEPGRGVDVVLLPNAPLPFRDGAFDLITCSSMMEHDEFFWLTFLEMVRVLKPGGRLYVSAPSNGIYHAFPRDAWRFYPDAGRCLASWATRNALPTSLLESFLGRRQVSGWNDNVMVFQRPPITTPAFFMSDSCPCYNIRRYGVEELLNKQIESEDQEFLRHLAQNSANLLNRWRTGENGEQLHLDTKAFLESFTIVIPS